MTMFSQNINGQQMCEKIVHLISNQISSNIKVLFLPTKLQISKINIKLINIKLFL